MLQFLQRGQTSIRKLQALQKLRFRNHGSENMPADSEAKAPRFTKLDSAIPSCEDFEDAHTIRFGVWGFAANVLEEIGM